MKRRTLLATATICGAGSVIPAWPNSRFKIKAVAFDGLAAFDPRPVAALAESLFPGRGSELSNAWRTRQFEYTWLRTLTTRYADFMQVTEDALIFAAKLLNLQMTTEKRRQLLHAFLELPAWPDTVAAVKSLKELGLRMVLLSNFTERMMDSAVRNSGLQGMFEAHLSTDRVRAYKPHPRAYQMALDALKLRREEIVFAAFGGWDAAGAKTFGYRTFWANRMNLPAEHLGASADGTGNNLHDLVKFVQA